MLLVDLATTVLISMQLLAIVGKLRDFKHQKWVKIFMLTLKIFTQPVTRVTGYEKRGLIHAFNFSTLRMCNSAHI